MLDITVSVFVTVAIWQLLFSSLFIFLQLQASIWDHFLSTQRISCRVFFNAGFPAALLPVCMWTTLFTTVSERSFYRGRVLHWPRISFNKRKHSTAFPFPLLVFSGQPSFCFLLHPSLLSKFLTLLLIFWSLTMVCLDLSVLSLSCLRFIGLLSVWGKFLTIFLPQMTYPTPTPLCSFHLGLYLHIIHITGTFDLSLTLCSLSGLCVCSYFLTYLFYCLLVSTFTGIFISVIILFLLIREALEFIQAKQLFL